MNTARLAAAVLAALVSLGVTGCGGGGTAVGPDVDEKGVFTGFRGDLSWDASENLAEGAGVGEGGDGDGGVGVGGALGQFRGALVKVFFPDGTQLGEALTDDTNGMVTVRPGRDYAGALLVEIHGRDGATYFEEGKNTYVPFGQGRVLHAIVPRITRNIGITPFSEAGYQLALRCRSGQGPAQVCGQGQGQSNQSLPGNDAVRAANAHVARVVNEQFPASLQMDDPTRLPFIVNDTTGQGAVATDARGQYGLMNVAFSKQAAMYNTTDAAPTLLATDQFSADLLDGRLDGRSNDAPSAVAANRTYDPHTFTSELSAALSQQTYRYGNSAALAALPPVVAFGNVRYDSYYFDARIGSAGTADTVAVATETASTERLPGDVTDYVVPQNDRRGFMVYGNMGSGSLFIKTDSADSTSRMIALGDNTNGELGNGNTSEVDQPVELSLPGVLTHAVGGYGHTLTRFADGSVYAFGDNAEGQLGQGLSGAALPRTTSPRQVALPTGAVSIAAANASSFALLESGQVYSWGSGWGFGTLGDGSANGLRTSPAPVLSTNGTLDQVVQLSARDNDAIALRADGSVWTWGSFSQDIAPSVPIPMGVQAGRTVATRIDGLPDAPVRKVLTEQGLFIALIGQSTDDSAAGQAGAVYTWGIHFDITANTYLVDLQPTRVLNLPPVRDVMPGGFNGYGQRPFDRLTAMAVDYKGRLWKIRGRVAERYDPANPTAQRRPQGQAPRTDCASCHTVRGADDPPVVTDGVACVLPAFKLDSSGQPALVNSASDCGSCHNGNALASGQVLAPLTCVPPALPAPPPPTNAEAQSGQCQLPVQHPPAPPGTFCASCHNGVVTAPLSCSPDAGVVEPPSTTTAQIASVLDNAGPVTGAVAPGGITDDATPTVSGTLSAPLGAGETLRIRANGSELGSARVNGSNWQFTPSTLSEGSYAISARVVNAGGASGAVSESFTVVVSTSPVTTTASINRLTDDVGLRTGDIPAGGVTNDPQLRIAGRLGAPLAAGQVLRLRRTGPDGTRESEVTQVSGQDFSLTDPSAMTANGTYTFDAYVVSATGTSGPAGQAVAVVFDDQPPAVPVLSGVFADFPRSTRVPTTGAINPQGGTHDNTPELRAVMDNPQPGDGIEFYEAETLLSNGPVPVDGQGTAIHVHNTQFPLGQTAGFNATYRLFYNAVGVDAAGNRSAPSPSHLVNFGFFDCEQLRRARTDSHFPGRDCTACHTPHPNANNPLRLQMPGTDPYWCTNGSGDLTPLPRP